MALLEVNQVEKFNPPNKEGLVERTANIFEQIT